MIFSIIPFLEVQMVKAKRLHFFKAIVSELMQVPDEVDKIMGQTEYWCAPRVEELILTDHTLIVHVYPEFHGRKMHFFYSIYQIGDMLRVGIILDNDIETAPLLEGQNEIDHLWHEVSPEVQDRNGSVMYQWSFQVSNFFDSWVRREYFARGVRHCHFRMLRIIHDGTQE